MSLAGVAKDNLSIISRGAYQTEEGATITFRSEVEAAIQGTRLYTPSGLEQLLSRQVPTQGAPRIELSAEGTVGAARRLVEVEREPHVVMLNFASAKNPGGGYVRGAKAQEEDLARCSALYNCQLTQRGYYDANRSEDSLLYTDHIIYSPNVPFLRDERYSLIRPFLASVITAPAPNAGEFLRREPNGLAKIKTALLRRTSMVLAVAAEHRHRCLVLGAWGCGVFRNDPRDVAGAFAHWLAQPMFGGAFDRVVFAIYERDKNKPTLRAFEDVLRVQKTP